MATERHELELVATAPSTSAVPPAAPIASSAVEPVTGRDILEIVVERRLREQDGDGGSRSMTIFRVPAHVRDANKELYEPRLVSIGPYYRGRKTLRTMEQHKWRYLRDLLAEHPEVSLANCVEAVRNKEEEARRCYTEPCATDFAEMLLLDGCFILQFFNKLHNGETDKLIGVGWGLGLLHSDLLLLENQIPFVVLQALFNVLAPEAESFHIFSLILPHLQLDDSTFLDRPLTVKEVAAGHGQIDHLLHLFYVAFVPRIERMVLTQDSQPRFLQFVAQQMREQCIRFKNAVSRNCILPSNMPDNGAQPAPPPLVVPSVTMLRKAGVRFKKEDSPRHMFDVTFDNGKGVVRIPRVEVDQASKPLLVNLIAFEQTMGLRGTALLLSSYTALMGFLVRTGQDVEHLQKRGIMDNLLSNDDDAAMSFFRPRAAAAAWTTRITTLPRYSLIWTSTTRQTGISIRPSFAGTTAAAHGR